MKPRFRLDTSGEWSGGGRAFITNFKMAADQYPLLNGSTDDIPVIPRNVPVGRWVRRPYVLIPQNAWPWAPRFEGARELVMVSKLRAASEVYAAGALDVLRISEAVPDRISGNGRVLHNVLDSGFEQAYVAADSVTAPETKGSILSLGSGYSYRNFAVLIEAYGEYRRLGGSLGLVLGGKFPSAGAVRELRGLLSGLPETAVIDAPLPRPTVLRMLRRANAVVLPSRVEASPLSALEAVVLNDQVILSDIVGHRGILRAAGVELGGWFAPEDRAGLARQLLKAEARELPSAGVLRDSSAREQARQEWSHHLAMWFQDRADRR